MFACTSSLCSEDEPGHSLCGHTYEPSFGARAKHFSDEIATFQVQMLRTVTKAAAALSVNLSILHPSRRFDSLQDQQGSALQDVFHGSWDQLEVDPGKFEHLRTCKTYLKYRHVPFRSWRPELSIP